MNITYLLLGSNLGNSKQMLHDATVLINRFIGKTRKASQFYRTAAWGKSDQPDFLNQVLIVETELAAAAIMEKILHIESGLGRVRTKKNDPRIIDIDILFYNNEVIETETLVV